MGKIGRNDPCPCGSGKKYKYCCLRKERQARQSPHGVTQRDTVDMTLSLSTIRRQLQDIPPGESPEARAELERLLNIAESMAAYEQHSDAIEAAAEELEAHRGEFEKLMSDPPSALDYAQDLFSEDRFADFRYTPEDIHQAFETVGYPRFYRKTPAPEDMETMFKAMVALVDEKDRLHLSRQLLILLPEYVAAGRYLDAWLIQISAYQMVEFPQESNPFLTSMFFLAYDEWHQQRQTEHESILEDLDLAQAKRDDLTEEEVFSLIEGKMKDPEWKARAEAYYSEQPLAREQAEAQFREMEQKSVDVLQRDDARHLYLSREEVAPWVYEFMERQADVVEAFKEAEREGREPDAEVIEKMERVMAGVLMDMAESIFTPERKDQLAEKLTSYRHQIQAAGEPKAAHLIYVAATTVTYDESPTHNPFLTGLCFYSLRAALATLGQELAAKETE